MDDVYELLRLLIEVYGRLEIPFRLRLAEPPELSFTEQLRVDLEVWSPFEKTWKPVAHVASHGQFIASRLTMVLDYSRNFDNPFFELGDLLS